MSGFAGEMRAGGGACRRGLWLTFLSPFGLELRRMQMISEVGAEQNSTTIIMMPSEFVTLAKGLGTYLGRDHAPIPR